MPRPTKRPLQEQAAILTGDVPIFDCEVEKRMADKGEMSYCHYLRALAGTRGLYVPPDVLRKRISDVYRLCFEGRNPDVTVVADLAAHHPGLAMQAPWLAEILGGPLLHSFRNSRTGENRLLKALGVGFKRAAKPPNWKRLKRDAGRDVFLTIKPDLERLGAELRDSQREGTKEARKRADAQIDEKPKELKRYGDFSSVQDQVRKLLHGGKGYEAAGLITSNLVKTSKLEITSKLWNVRKRDLEARSDVEKAAEAIRTIHEATHSQAKS